MPLTLRFYFASLFLLAVVLGIQITLLPWLVIDDLALSSMEVGVVQAGVLLPNLIFLLLGGLSADNGKVLGRFQQLCLAYIVVHSLLLGLLWSASLGFISLLIYALLLGVVNGFLQPCKEFVLASLAGEQRQSTIAKASIVQFIGQGIGILLVSQFYHEWIMALPILQIVLLVLALLLLSLVKKQSALNFSELLTDKSPVHWRQSLSGIKYCWQTPLLRDLITVIVFNGFFHIGVFIVALPVLVKQTYGGNVDLYSWLQGLFVLGSIVTALIVIYRKKLAEPGRRFVFSLLYSGVILLALSGKPTVYGLLFMVFLWGIVVGLSSTMGRSILQSHLETELKGRVIAVYQLALFGFAPLGAVVAGFLIEWLGVLSVLRYAGIASFLGFALMMINSPLWQAETEGNKQP